MSNIIKPNLHIEIEEDINQTVYPVIHIEYYYKNIKKSTIEIIGVYDNLEDAKRVRDLWPDDYPNNFTKVYKIEVGKDYHQNDKGYMAYEKLGYGFVM
jgi:hypothetical protein